MKIRHKAMVVDTPQPNRGYPAMAVCVCGWKSRPYAREHAAQIMADAHIEEVLPVPERY